MTDNINVRLIKQMAYGFWVRTKRTPHRAVRWDQQIRDDGRPTFKGRNWVEVLAYREDREPERFYGADVELAGPHERLHYYPALNEPVCGWQEAEWLASGEFCPRVRERLADGSLEPFCRKHMHELGEESNAHTREGGSHPE